MRRPRQYPIVQPQRDIRAITQESIIEYLYLLSEKAHQQIVDTYCHKQMQLVEKQAFFIRGYNTYTHSSLSLNDIRNVYPLHESLVESFDEYLDHRKQQVFRDVYIKTTIANALNITVTISDILELLPPAITNAFSNTVLQTIRCVEPTVTPADIEKFNINNEQGLQLIREQLLTNMLEG